jgi:hypothetical protein
MVVKFKKEEKTWKGSFKLKVDSLTRMIIKNMKSEKEESSRAEAITLLLKVREVVSENGKESRANN